MINCKLCNKICVWIKKNNICSNDDWRKLQKNPKKHIIFHAMFNTGDWRESPLREEFLHWISNSPLMLEYCSKCDDLTQVEFDFDNEKCIQEPHRCECGEQHGIEIYERKCFCSKCKTYKRTDIEEITHYID